MFAPDRPLLVDVDWTPGESFGLVELVRLACRRPPETIEVGVPTPGGYFLPTTDPNILAQVGSMLERVRVSPTWIVLKDIQQDEMYSEHVKFVFGALPRSTHRRSQGTFNHRCHVFISSDGARTPMHADDCNGALVQIAGAKELAIYDMGRHHFSPRLARRQARTSRVFSLSAAADAGTEHRYVVRKGSALTIPWNWPHEAVTPAGSHSVSLNVSYETHQTDELARASLTNDVLLQLGRRPRSVGLHRGSDWVKARIGSVLESTGMLDRIEHYDSLEERYGSGL